MGRLGSIGSEGRISGFVLKLLREAMPRTQQELADDLGVQVATVQGWESGRRPIMAMSERNFLTLRRHLRRIGASTSLLQTLPAAVEADLFVAEALETPHLAADPREHLLGSWVLTRAFTGLVGWPLNGQVPAELEHVTTASRARRGPVPGGPTLDVDERTHLVGHLQALAERADRSDASGLLLIRQTNYLLSFDADPRTTDWLQDMHRAEQRRSRPGAGWSLRWPLARSTACALARLGDPFPLEQFITEQLGDDETAEQANLNYWAFWVGDLPEQRSGDDFMRSTPVHAWRGNRLLTHLNDRLQHDVRFLDLNVHTLRSLVRADPHLVGDPVVTREITATIACLLDESHLTRRTRVELEEVRRVIRGGTAD